MGQLKSKVDRQLFDSKNSSPSSQNASQSAVNNASFTNLNTTTTADDNISPGLARLRNTPGKLFQLEGHMLYFFGQLRGQFP